MKRFVLIVGWVSMMSGCVLEESAGSDAAPASDSGCTDCTDAGSDAAPECTGWSDCDDGSFCNGHEQCLAGTCVPGAPPNCDDGVDCTGDACSDESGGCLHEADDAACANRGTCSPASGGCVGPEVCNGLDDDLDGEADDWVSAPCETACGTGEMLCIGGVFAPETCSAPLPVPESCDGLDSDCDGVIDEGCVAPCSGTNIVVAGSFEGTLDGWLNEVHPVASASFSADCSTATDGRCSALLDTATAAEYYDVQLKQIEVPTIPGMLYQLCLDLAAKTPRDVVLEYMEDDDPYATGGLWELVSIDERWREVCFTFVAMDVSPTRLTLGVGADEVAVWVDDVRLRSCP